MTDTNTILSFIQEIQTDKNKFIREHAAEPITRDKLSVLIKELDLPVNITCSKFVLSMQAEQANRVLSEEYARRLFQHPQYIVMIQNRRLFFDNKDETAQVQILGQLNKMEVEDIELLVKALRKLPGNKSVSKKEPTLGEQILELLRRSDEGLTLDDLAKALSSKNVPNIRRSIRQLINNEKVDIVNAKYVKKQFNAA